ncbi:MAG TPA: hypothetical protein VF904_03540 [Anaeromyxobacteraceae bacterium]
MRATVDADRDRHGGARMNRSKALLASLYSAALSLWVLPALALAQATQPGSAPAPSNPPSGAPAGSAGGASSGAGWLWIIAAIIVLAIVWWAMSSRRRHGTVTR